MSGKSLIVSILGILVLIGGVIAGVLLVRERQEIREKAAVPGGQARVSLFPTSGNFNIGDSLPVSIYFNTSDIYISSITLRLRYPFSGTSPEVTASNIAINSVLANSGSWNCPTKTVTTEGTNVLIDIRCANVSATGYKTNTDTLLATFDLTVNRIPLTNPFTLSFDPTQSIITQKSNGQDILNIPDQQTASGVYTITSSGGEEPTAPPTATPTKVTTIAPTATIKPTGTIAPTATIRPTATVRPTGTLSPSPTSSVNLPDAGFGAPTFVGLGLGVVFILSAILLAL